MNVIQSKQDLAFEVSIESPPMPPQSLHFPLLRVYLGHQNIQPRQTVHSPGYGVRQESYSQVLIPLLLSGRSLGINF